MSLIIARQKFERLRADLDKTRAEEYEKIVLDAVALLKARVINTGKDADGKPFGKYSDAVVPFWFYAGKDGVSSNDVNRLYEQHGYFASYKDLREVKGRPTNIKNFSFTNKMWNNLKATVLNEKGGIVTFGFKTSSDREVPLEVHQEQSEILELAKAERELIQSLSRKRLQNAINRAGL